MVSDDLHIAECGDIHGQYEKDALFKCIVGKITPLARASRIGLDHDKMHLHIFQSHTSPQT